MVKEVNILNKPTVLPTLLAVKNDRLADDGNLIFFDMLKGFLL